MLTIEGLENSCCIGTLMHAYIPTSFVAWHPLRDLGDSYHTRHSHTDTHEPLDVDEMLIEAEKKDQRHLTYTRVWCGRDDRLEPIVGL
jgi:hypothetical protein